MAKYSTPNMMRRKVFGYRREFIIAFAKFLEYNVSLRLVPPRPPSPASAPPSPHAPRHTPSHSPPYAPPDAPRLLPHTAPDFSVPFAQSNRVRQFRHSGKWEFRESEGCHMWSDTACFERNSPGDVVRVHNPTGFNFSSPCLTRVVARELS